MLSVRFILNLAINFVSACTPGLLNFLSSVYDGRLHHVEDSADVSADRCSAENCEVLSCPGDQPRGGRGKGSGVVVPGENGRTETD